jgi:hypothetical protein
MVPAAIATKSTLNVSDAGLCGVDGSTLCANDNETKYPVKFRLRAT